jgi:hypothetical protein
MSTLALGPGQVQDNCKVTGDADFRPAVSTSLRPQDDADSQICETVPSLHTQQNDSGGAEALVHDLSSEVAPDGPHSEPHRSTLANTQCAPCSAHGEPSLRSLQTKVDQLVDAVADKFRDDKDEPLTLREVLRTGDLNGQLVEFHKAGHLSNPGECGWLNLHRLRCVHREVQP